MFSLNDFEQQENNYVSKILLPGTHKCSIYDLKLEKPPYDPEQYNLIITLVGPDMGNDFQGLAISKTDASKGNFKGQVANVRANQYGFKNWVYEGKPISRDKSIQTFLGNFLLQLNLLEEFKKENVSADTIEDLVEEIRVFLKKRDESYWFTVGGQKYYKEGSTYPNYSLFLPKKTEGKYAFSHDYDDPKFYTFNESLHVYEKKSSENNVNNETVSTFAPPVDNSIFTSQPSLANESFNATQHPVFENNVNDLHLP